MILLKDGVRYFLHEYASEEELEGMAIEHHKDIFGTNSLFFDPQTMRTRMGIETRNDGLVLVADQKKWYIVEVELAKHPLHDHIIPQITKFSIAYEDEKTRKRIINTLYKTIRDDLTRTAVIQTLEVEDLHKILTDLIDTQPAIAIIIDQKTPELDFICKKLPFITQTIEFKTYARENIGLGVHIHEFQPLDEKRTKTRPPEQVRVTEEMPRKLTQVLEVAGLVFKGEQLNRAFKSVADLHSVHVSTVRDKCTRQLNIDTHRFRELIQDKDRFITYLKEKYPQWVALINERLA